MQTSLKHFIEFEDFAVSRKRSSTESRGYSAIGLDNPKSAINVGSILRAAGCFDSDMVVVGGPRPDRFLKRCLTDVHKAYRHLPVLKIPNLQEAIPHDCVPVAVDLIEGAQSLTTYKHPERAFYIFGAEDATLGDRVTSWCRDVIYIPTSNCLNLAAAVNVILYDRMAKQLNN